MKAWLILLSCLLLTHSETPVTEEDQFKDFIKKYNKAYSSEEEYNKRFQIFKDNLKTIESLNAEGSTNYGITKFADLTQEEMKQYTFYVKPKNTTKLAANDEILKTLKYKQNGFYKTLKDSSNSIDLRAEGLINPPQNQSTCGGCWAFAGCANLEAQYKRVHGELPKISEQQFIDCISDAGCDGGNLYDIHKYLQSNNYIMKASDYPFSVNEDRKRCPSSSTLRSRGIYFNYSASYSLRNDRNLEQIKQALQQFGPLFIGVSAESQLRLSLYENGIIPASRGRNCARLSPDHAVNIVGFGNENGTDYWIIKNSWGDDWGENGYFRMEASNDYNRCFFEDVEFSLLKPQDPNANKKNNGGGVYSGAMRIGRINWLTVLIGLIILF